MRICLNLKKLNGTIIKTEPIKLVLKMGDHQTMSTEFSQPIGSCYGYMEKHYLKIGHTHSLPFVQILLISFSGLVISQRTVFYAKFKEFTQINLTSKSGTFTLFYDVKQESKEEETYANNSFLSQHTQILNNQQDKISVIKLGLSFVRFAQRVDPVVFLFNKACHFFLWKDIKTTLAVAILISLFIYYFEIAVFLCGVLLYFSQGFMLKKFQNIHKYDYVSKRILLPQQNTDFLHIVTDWYTGLYQSIGKILFAHDKAFLVKLIKLFCKLSLINIILVFFTDFKTIFILAFWTILAFTSPLKSTIVTQLKPLILSLLEEYFKVTDKLSKEISSVFKKSVITSYEEDYYRQFYLFQYESWSVFNGWTKNLQTIPNQNEQCITIMKTSAPQGWIWATDWKIDYQGNLDQEGYQYLKFNQYTSSSTLSTRRRRKWKRCCVKDIYS